MRGEAASAALYRFSRKAQAREAHEEAFRSADGNEFAVTVQPISGGCTAWWFAPRASPSVAVTNGQDAGPPTVFFDDAPVGLALVAQDGTILEANALFCHFFQIVEELDARKEVERQLHARIAVAAVGPTCAEALRENGIEPDVVPSHPKMGTMIVALAKYFSSDKNATDSNRKDSNPAAKCLS